MSGAAVAPARPPAWTANSRCECQASLRAELDEELQVLRGSAFFHGKRELAPAHALLGSATGGTTPRFDLHWACPFCTRNVLRSFTAGALQRVRAGAVSS
jgi:hypothetical protein